MLMWMIVWYFPYLMDLDEDLNQSVDFFRIFDYNPTISNEGGEIKKKEEVEGKIEFKNVSFAYPTKPAIKVLKNINCTIEAG